jgi:PPOX class probable F420-dependent enzyme
MKPLPGSVKKLIEAKTYANIATMMPDGTPQVTQTWVDHEGDFVLINTFEGSQKYRNVKRNPKVALDIVDPMNPYNVAFIRGVVKEVTFVGAEEHVDRMAKKYLGTDTYGMRRPGVRRVLIKIEPTHATAPFEERKEWKAWEKNKAP